MAIEATQLLRAGLLDGTSIALACSGAAERGAAGAAARSFAEAVELACGGLGARVERVRVLGAEAPHGVRAEPEIERAVADALARAGELDMLIVDAAGLCASLRESGGGDGRRALVGGLEACWTVTRALVDAAFLARSRGGRVVYVCPAPDAMTAHGEAAVAGIENLARTLSIEWARHGVSTVALAPGSGTAASEVGALCAYLASAAGAYFSGTLLDLRAARGG